MTTQNTDDGTIVLARIALPGTAIIAALGSLTVTAAPHGISMVLIPVTIWWVVTIFAGRARLRRARQLAWQHGQLAHASRAYLPGWQQGLFTVAMIITMVIGLGTMSSALGAVATVAAAVFLGMGLRAAYVRRALELERFAASRTEAETAIDRLAPGGKIPLDEWRVLFENMGLAGKFQLLGIDELADGDARLRFRGAPGTHVGQLQSLDEAICAHWNLLRVSEAKQDHSTGQLYMIASLNPVQEQAEPTDEWN